jgi:hypothetical protein
LLKIKPLKNESSHPQKVSEPLEHKTQIFEKLKIWRVIKMRYTKLAGAIAMSLGMLATETVSSAEVVGPGVFGSAQYLVLIYDESISWDEAKAACKSREGYSLADILSVEENNFVVGLLQQVDWGSFPYKGVWMGHTDKAVEGEWIWEATTGNPIGPYINWGFGGTNGAMTENCGAIELARSSAPDGWWNDATCSGAANVYPGALCVKREVLLATDVNLTATLNGSGVDLTLTTSAEPDTAKLLILRGEKRGNDATEVTVVCEFPSGGSPYTCTDNAVGYDYRAAEIEYDGSLLIQNKAVKPKK